MTKLFRDCRILLIFCIAILHFSITEAGNSDYYADLIRHGQYCIICHIDFGSNYNSGKDNVGKQTIVLLEDKVKGLKYFSSYQHGDANKYYILSQILEYNNQSFACHDERKKVIEIEAEKKKALEIVDKNDPMYWVYYEMPKVQAISALFGSLADITEKNNILKNYKTEYKGSGIYDHEGVSYSYDEYVIKLPKESGLKIYYKNGTIFRCVRLGNDQLYNHPFLFSEKIKSDSMNVISFEKFDNDIEEIEKNIFDRINCNEVKSGNKKRRNWKNRYMP